MDYTRTQPSTKCDFLDNRAVHGNGRCLNYVLNVSNVDVMASNNFKKNRASGDGSDIFTKDDGTLFVKCEDHADVFCDGFGGIDDDGRKDSTSCTSL